MAGTAEGRPGVTPAVEPAGGPSMTVRGRARSGRPNFLHYVTSKAALIGMTRSLARELGPDGITVNAVMPSLTKTEVEFAGVTDQVFADMRARQCIPRTGTAEDLAGALLFLASSASGFITGQTIAVDGGAVHL